MTAGASPSETPAWRRPPGPPRSLIPGLVAWRLLRNPLGQLTWLARSYGDIAALHFGSRQLTLLNHPDFIQTVLRDRSTAFVKGQALQRSRRFLGEGLLTSEGDQHLRQRRMIQPVFHRQRIAGYGEIMTEQALRLGQSWQDGQALDLHAAMMHLAMGIAAQALFDIDVQSQAGQVSAALNTLLADFNRLALPFSDALLRLPLPSNRRTLQAMHSLDQVIQQMIEQRRADLAAPVDLAARHDLLSLLLQATDEHGQGMSDRQIRDEALTLFLAGHETTANALTWTWYLLCCNPQVEAQLLNELRLVLGGRPPAAADLDRLVYTRMVLQEALRLYPPAWVIGRQALQDLELGGYAIARGSTVLMSQWVMHRDPRYYPDPERFDPQRWLPEAQAARPRFAYFPFGGGPRLCIGEGFAWMEATLVLAALVQTWQVRLAPGYTAVPQPGITLRPKGGLPVVVNRRPGAGLFDNPHGSEFERAGILRP